MSRNNLTEVTEINSDHLEEYTLDDNPIRTLSKYSISMLDDGRLYFSPKFLTKRGQEIYYNQNPQRYSELLKYYKKNPKTLALDYVSKPKSLTKDELERLVHEAGMWEIKYLEDHLQPEDSILNKIMVHSAVELSNGLKIFL